MIQILYSIGFITLIPLHKNNIPKCNSANQQCICNEHVLYRKYLIGLRKTRKILQNNTNVNTMISILNFTNEYVKANNISVFNNTEVGAKNIIMGNIVLDVSNVKEIHIITKKDKIIVELDKKKDIIPITNVLSGINNIDSIITTIALIGKIMNVN